MLLCFQMNYEDVGLNSRYHKYQYWNSSLELEFLQNLVAEYSDDNGDSEMVTNDEPRPVPIIETPLWSLSLASEDNYPESSNYRSKVSRKKSLLKELPSDPEERLRRIRQDRFKQKFLSIYQSHNWSDLLLVPNFGDCPNKPPPPVFVDHNVSYNHHNVTYSHLENGGEHLIDFVNIRFVSFHSTIKSVY